MIRPGNALAAGFLCLSLGLIVSASAAQQLHLETYDVGGGLSHGRVPCISSDPAGYVWFGTWEGLSRFDGERFTRIDVQDGLTEPLVNSIAHDRRGGLWAATWGGGVAWVGAETNAGRPRVRFFRIGDERQQNLAFRLAIDREERLWVVTESGVFRTAESIAEPDSLHFLPMASDGAGDSAAGDAAAGDLAAGDPAAGQLVAGDLVRTAEGAVWLTAGGALLRIDGDRRDRFSQEGAAPHLLAAAAGARDTVYAASGRAAWRVVRAGSTATWTSLPLDLPADATIRCLQPVERGVWIGTTAGLFRWQGERMERWTRREGLADDFVRALGVDREGNLWMATNASGVARYSGEAIVRFTMFGEHSDVYCLSNVISHDDRIYTTTSGRGIFELREEGARLVPGSLHPAFNDINYCLRQDGFGDWWAGSAHGLYRAEGPDLDLRRTERITECGLGETAIIGIAYDAERHRLWVGGDRDSIVEGDLSVRGVRRFRAHPIPFPDSLSGIRTFSVDARGRLWVSGFVGLGIFADGEWTLLGPRNGIHDNRGRCFHRDAAGRLWIGFRHNGAVVCDDPEADVPIFRPAGERAMFASGTVWAITSDESGLVYFATGRGLDRLDPSTGRIEHFSTADGLAGTTVLHAVRDRRNRIWTATSRGVSRLDPALDDVEIHDPPVYLTSIEVAGVRRSLTRSGVTSYGPLRLGPSENNIRLEYVAPAFRRAVRYQYRLEGADSDWQDPTRERVVQYAHLAPGDYRFLVRAIDARGRPGAQEANVTLEVLPPIWQRAWFLAMIGGALALGAFTWHRVRLGQVLALERIRQRIASDLHDEVGSGLAQIAILTEVARRDPTGPGAQFLEQSAALARTLRAAMSDIVWAIDPRRDRLSDVIERIRQFSWDLLESQGLRVDYQVPPEETITGVALGPDARRHLYLWLKEALTNVAKHAGASRVEVRIERVARRLVVEVSDDGRGFELSEASAGLGRQSLAERAQALRGTHAVHTSPGSGTRLRLEIPV